MATEPTADQLLDNPVWYALGGPLSEFAETPPAAPARRFQQDIAFFGAVADTDRAGWAALAELVGPDGTAVLFRDRVPTPPRGWSEVYRGSGFQLVARELSPAPDLALVALGEEDADEMLALVALTEPGPFMQRTVALGGYLGLRREGRLIAMAGRRFRVPGFTEISAVCTHPDARRQGLGAALTLAVAHRIRESGGEAFLHVLGTNESALSLYRTLGFEVRRKIDVVAAIFGEPPDEGAGSRDVHSRAPHAS
jgi:predicted GNAT family acetyltransferase